jgi:hypothetical protein
MSSRIIRIEYSEIGDPDYKGIVISDVQETIQTFYTGDVVADFAAMKDWCRANPFDGRYFYSSSVDHFTMDVPGYGWASDEDGRDVLIRVPVEEQDRAVDEEA